MSVMTVRYGETLHRTLLFLCRTLSDVRRLFQALTELSTNYGLAINYLQKHLVPKGARHFFKAELAITVFLKYYYVLSCIVNVFFYLKKSNVSFSRYLDFFYDSAKFKISDITINITAHYKIYNMICCINLIRF